MIEKEVKKREREKRCSDQFVQSSTPVELSAFFSLSFAFCYVTASFLPVFLHHYLLPSFSPLSLFLSCLSLRKRPSRNKAINKKSTAFSVPPHYRLLMYAFCSSITHQLQINALIFPSARLISVAVTTAQRGAVHCKPFSKYQQMSQMPEITQAKMHYVEKGDK